MRYGFTDLTVVCATTFFLRLRARPRFRLGFTVAIAWIVPGRRGGERQKKGVDNVETRRSERRALRRLDARVCVCCAGAVKY